MADKETGLNIPVSAYADKDSAKEAVNELTKGVLKSLKDGYIEVPAEIKASFTRGSKELEKAQKDVINQWEKMSKEGFSSSEEYLDDLINKYKKFKSLAGKEGKGNSKQSKWLTKNIGESLQPYLNQKRELTSIIASFDKSTKKYSQKAIKGGLDAWAKEIKGKSSRKQRYADIKQTGPKGIKSDVSLNRGVATSKTAIATEYGGSYPSNFSRQMKQSEHEFKPKTLKDTVDKAQAENSYKEAIKKSTHNLTEQEAALEKANLAANKMTEALSEIEHGKEDATSEDFKKYVKGTATYINQAGRSDWDSMSLTTNKALHRYTNTTGTIGLGYDKVKGEGINHTEAKKALKDVMDTFTDIMKDSEKSLKAYEAQQRRILARLKDWKGIEELDKGKSYSSVTSVKNKDNTLLAQELNELQSTTKETAKTIDIGNKTTNKQMQLDMIEHSAERVADTTEAQKNKEIASAISEDLETGFNTDSKADQAIDAFNNFQGIKEVLNSILAVVESINKNGVNVKASKSKNLGYFTDIQKSLQRVLKPNSQLLLPPGRPRLGLPQPQGKFSRSEISTSLKDPAKWYIRLKDNLASLIGVTAKYKKVVAATSDEQDEMAANRIKEYGFDRGRGGLTDKVAMARRLSLIRNKDIFKNIFPNLKISEGIKLDTTEVTDKLGRFLSGKAMRNAQMGGSPLRQLIGFGTGFIGMPSIEKSRAAADALNQINANIREAMNATLEDIQNKESALAGMVTSGDLKLGENGEVLESSTTEAKTLAAELENSKLILDSILADMGMVNKSVDKSHGSIKRTFKYLSFTSPALRKNNAIVNNINAGYDKGGKALKFQTRLAEILNYTFRLMSRHLGQTIKRWIVSLGQMLNPITHIKKLFSDFMGYDTKWQRTMNVIKYNLRAVAKPLMEWIAQKLVNIIGFLDIISMKVQEAFGKTPISLFDQSAADAEKMREELEAAANVTASFDELHDIGSDNSGANDLFGDIYKPQLSQEWIDLANKIGDLFAGLIKGDLGFGEVMKTILEILWEGLKKIAKKIWDWFKETAIGKWITEHWKTLLKDLLLIFLGWQLLKIAGKLIWNALFGNLSGGALGGFFSTLGAKITAGFGTIWKSGGLIGMIKSGGASLGTILGTTLMAAAGVTIAAVGINYFGNKADENTAYNAGLMDYGGDESNKKSNTGNIIGATLTGAGGGALAGFAIGGPLGAAIGAGIGAIAGIIRTTLVPALEEAEIASKNLNNEMQNIQYYEGAAQGAEDKVNSLTEQMQLMDKTVETHIQNLYKEGEEYGVCSARMDMLIEAVQNGTFTTDMLTESELGLSDSLNRLMQLQDLAKGASERYTESQRKLLQAQTDLAIAQDKEAGHFELAAARIGLAEEEGVYTTEEATKKRIQLYKESSDEQRRNLLLNLTPDQRKLMMEYNGATEEELADLVRMWQDSSYETRQALLDGVGPETQEEFRRRMDEITGIVQEHQGVWQGVKDTLAEVFTFGKAETWTYNGEEKAIKLYAHSYDVGTNYVPNDGLAYLHQGEAVIPAKYNRPYTPNNSSLENAINQLNAQVAQISTQVNQGINVHGQFIQRGSDLVATVQKADNKLSNSILNNKVYAR